MRQLFFVFSAIAISVAVQSSLYQVPDAVYQATHGMLTPIFFLSPIIVTVGLAYAMRVRGFFTVYFLAILSPVISWVTMVLIDVNVLHHKFYLW